MQESENPTCITVKQEVCGGTGKGSEASNMVNDLVKRVGLCNVYGLLPNSPDTVALLHVNELLHDFAKDNDLR